MNSALQTNVPVLVYGGASRQIAEFVRSHRQVGVLDLRTDILKTAELRSTLAAAFDTDGLLLLLPERVPPAVWSVLREFKRGYLVVDAQERKRVPETFKLMAWSPNEEPGELEVIFPVRLSATLLEKTGSR